MNWLTEWGWDALKVLGIGVAVGVIGFWATGIRYLAREFVRNQNNPAPDDQQIRWHIRQMRVDLLITVRLLLVIIAMLVAALAFLLWQHPPLWN